MRPMLALALLLSAVPATAAPPPYVAAAIADPDRSAKAREMDAVRKPVETLVFSGVRPGMVVGEFYPGSGYFTRLLNTIVGPAGRVYAVENKKWEGPQGAAAWVRLTNTTYSAGPFGAVDFPKPLDLAWVTQNYHDLKIAEYGVVDTAAFNRAVFAALKPGGTFMIVDHEAPKGTDVAGIVKLHRIEKAQVIREVTAAGFKFAGEGRFLASTTDDHSLSIFDKKVQGHTDQYALKFVKPAR